MISTPWRVLLATGLVLVSGCTDGQREPVRGTSDPPAPSGHALTASVVLPPPDQHGPRLTVEGVATWSGSHPGCVRMETNSGQGFQLTGTVASDNEQRAVTGRQPNIQRVRITGYVSAVGASVCGAGRAIVLEKVTPITQ